MSENQPSPPVFPDIIAQIAGQQAGQQVGQKALLDAGLDVPRLFASLIGLSDDPTNGIAALIFRDGVRAEYQIAGPNGQMIPQGQDVFRTVTTIVIPRETVKEFVKGAAKHFADQENVAAQVG